MTIFITISRGSIVRNLLQNEFFNLLKEKFDKVVILSFAASNEEFLRQFQKDNVEIIPLLESQSSRFDQLVCNINKYLAYNSSVSSRSRWGFYPGQNELSPALRYLKYIALKIIFQPLTKVTAVRKFWQCLDYLFFQRDIVQEYQKIIKEYKPNLVFVSSILDETEVALLKAAKKERVYTVAMPKSWDNPSKRYFRFKPDKLVVWSPFMKKQVKKLQDYKSDEVEVIGIPQFDYYIDKTRISSRENFCKSLGLNPQRRILLYGSEGRITPDDPRVVEIIKDMIKGGELIKDCQILVRPHYGYANDELKFKEYFNDNKDVFVDLNFKKSNFSDNWDYSTNQMNHFLNSLYHCDVLLNVASTLTIDTAAVDKPVILIYFDGYEEKDYRHSVKRLYESDYLQELVSYNAALKVSNPEELKRAINTFLVDPKYLNNERIKLREHFCYKLDGMAGERLFQFIYKIVKNR
ncbi:hypothetical protein COT99_02315 [Candidatus Falkowbacteria bacterium CG10_big_fil_rev_8_21_14_0_10_43_10]|uniref:UDP-N-acetylglucosamine 2-epimerase domain-containing protein n=1 Tax=Candidatus Falkowbacteria bacterium CG10_big_fil_rev_8_21_14_0_10_43_10 TaxID=1974567 RepID=A0A2H0V228_9BACT|nr:MAG: hypothetical protein COT99_02315 [Candidatus Falkowbacteria bacterium CG10_big_fil_rev_8_21_14_0_10_43_10]